MFQVPASTAEGFQPPGQLGQPDSWRYARKV
jgi:hypothetical protein